MKSKHTIETLTALGPCADGLAFAKSHQSLSIAWDKCDRPEWMIWFLKRTKSITPQQSVTLAAQFARRCLALFEAKFHDDKRPRLAIEAAENWAKNPAAYAASASAAAAYNSHFFTYIDRRIVLRK